ncbi:Hypothetical predicted protein [Olea europaea subsp. europaea]|uniref:Uncharacterized protein n=1 Tax=Olea europaea subsp. europaea TaxID=158383 RepID=A0A8S0SV47_OLEEU|nr:Hypothetical predicted protein [Olea europaea subsp. europaea]
MTTSSIHNIQSQIFLIYSNQTFTPLPTPQIPRFQFKTSYKYPKLIFPIKSHSQLFKEGNEVETDENEEDDDDVVAKECDIVSGKLGIESEEEKEYEEVAVERSNANEINDNEMKLEEYKWQRVERLQNEVRESGEEIINIVELSSICIFVIDKF